MKYEEQIKNLTEEQRLELLTKFIQDLGFKRVRHEQKRNKFLFRFEKSFLLQGTEGER